MISDTEIYKNTYHQLVCWIKELLEIRRNDERIYDRNIRQAGRIMSLEFALRKYSAMMVEDQQEQIVEKYAKAEGDVVSLEEFRKNYPRTKPKGPNGTTDWLTPMAWGTQFYVRPKLQKTWMLAKFLHAGLRKNAVLLVPMMGSEDVVADEREWLAVEPIAFCQYWELISEFPPIPIENNNERNLDAE